MPCFPASTIPVDAHIFGLAFIGTVTLDGQTYQDVNGFNSPDSLDMNLSGTIDVPAFQNAAVTISAPFDADGFFRHLDLSTGIVLRRPDSGQRQSHAESGARTRRNVVSRPHCAMTSATPTPEPATLTMVGAPLVAALIRARKRRDRRDHYSVVNEHADGVTAFRRSSAKRERMSGRPSLHRSSLASGVAIRLSATHEAETKEDPLCARSSWFPFS